MTELSHGQEWWYAPSQLQTRLIQHRPMKLGSRKNHNTVADTGSQEKGWVGFSGIHTIFFSVDLGQFRVRANSMSASTVHPITWVQSSRAAFGTRSIICVSAFRPVCMARLLIKDLFSFYVAVSQQCINLEKLLSVWRGLCIYCNTFSISSMFARTCNISIHQSSDHFLASNHQPPWMWPLHIHMILSSPYFSWKAGCQSQKRVGNFNNHRLTCVYLLLLWSCIGQSLPVEQKTMLNRLPSQIQRYWWYSGVTLVIVWWISVLDLFRNLQALFLCPDTVTGVQKYWQWSSMKESCVVVIKLTILI